MAAAGLEPLVVLWAGWGIHFMVLLSFTVQVTLLLLADIRRRKDWAWLKVVIWSAYMLADTAAIYSLGHMAVVCGSPEHQIMALWAPLLLVHLGGQDNMSAYAIEDNRLWLRHLQNFVVQVAAAGYVLYVSSIIFHPSKLRSAAILMFVVGFLKYSERIWALKRANSCASSSLSITSYDKVKISRSTTAGDDESNLARVVNKKNNHLIVAYSLLDAPKQMFEGPTSYVQISNVDNKVHEADYMLRVVNMQLSMMYDLLNTKAAVVHTWYGLCSRVLISLPFTVATVALFRSLLSHEKEGHYKREDVTITNFLLIGAVVLEILSLLRAIFSKWTAVLLYGMSWNTIGDVVLAVEGPVTRGIDKLLRSGACRWGHVWQHSIFKLDKHTDRSIGSKIARIVGVQDWWDANVYSWPVEVPYLAIEKVLQLVSEATFDQEKVSKATEDITRSRGKNAVRRGTNNNDQMVTWIWTDDLKLEETILVWHIATRFYLEWYRKNNPYLPGDAMWPEREAIEILANYMFFLLAARPYLLPYPVSRQSYVELRSEAIRHLPELDTILKQQKALMEGTPLKFAKKGRTQQTNEEEISSAPSMKNTTLDRGCQLAAKLIHITVRKGFYGQDTIFSSFSVQTKGANGEGIIPEQAVSPVNGGGVIPEQAESTVNGEGGEGIILEQAESTVDGEGINTEQTETFSVGCTEMLHMLLEVWTEMLCYTAYWCNENSHAKHLTEGGDILTIIALLMIYTKNGLSRKGPNFYHGAGLSNN